MNLIKKIFLLLIFINFYSCAEYQVNSKKNKVKKYHFSSGFALVYDEISFKNKSVNKKINNDKIVIMHDVLKANTPVKIINPLNSKSIETKIYKKANYPKIFNVVVSKKLAQMLDLDIDNPLVELLEVKKNKKFVAKEGNTFDEEKNVADKAPVEEIEMKDLSTSTESKKNVVKKNKFILVISDFYYIDSANDLKNQLEKKLNLNNASVKKINNNKYRLLVGPFKNFNALKTTYISLNNLGFESLDVYME